MIKKIIMIWNKIYKWKGIWWNIWKINDKNKNDMNDKMIMMNIKIIINKYDKN